jgi:hypothetical protein
LIFEVHVKTSEKSVKDASNFVFWRLPVRKISFIVLLALYGLLLLIAVATDIFYFHSLNFYTILLAAFIVILVLIRVLGADAQAKTLQKRTLEMNGGQYPEIVWRMEDGMLSMENLTSGNSVQPYRPSVKAVYDTVETVYLFTETKVVMDFPKNSFTKGTPEEFMDYYRSQGVKVRKA